MYHFMCFTIIYVDSAYQTSQQKNIDINILRSLLVRPLSYWRSASNNTRLLLECKSINIWPTIQMFYLIFCSTHFLLIFFQYTFFSNYLFLQYTFFSNYLFFSTHSTKKNIYSPPSLSWSISWTASSNCYVSYTFAFTCLTRADLCDWVSE